MRRAVTVPLYVGAAALWITTTPAWLLIALLVDVVSGQARRRPRSRAMVFVGLYLVSELVGIVIAAVIWAVTFGGVLGGRARFVNANATLQRWWTSALFHGSLVIYGARVELEGAEHVAGGPLLFFVRHTSVADAVLTAALVANPRRLVLRYVLKRELTWDPCLDIVGRRLPNAFVDRKAGRVRGDIDAIVELANGLDARSAVLIYPEGTRFTARKLSAAVENLKKGRHQELAETASTFRHVLPPRLGGPLALLESAPHVDVVFVEHTGFEGTATLDAFWKGALVGATIRVRLRRFAADSIPTAGRDAWLFGRWAEMDAWIDGTLTKNGHP